MFYSVFELFSLRISNPDLFHPGSYIKRWMKNKNNFFLAFYGFQMQLRYRDEEYEENVPEPGSRKNASLIRIPGGKKATDPGSSATLLIKHRTWSIAPRGCRPRS
jgi:hypothetical protein